EEMARVLHYGADDAALHAAFAALRKTLEELVQVSEQSSQKMQQFRMTNDPVMLAVANRLFGQVGYDFREPFQLLVKENYDAPFEKLDFTNDPAGARLRINKWVETQTRQRIQGLIPESGLDKLTRLVLVNALYLKAPWAERF